MKTTNKKSGFYVANLKEFKANNLEGRIENNFYVVYSYAWYPLFAYSFDSNEWFENNERYSVSTSKQRSQSHPLVNTNKISHEEMKGLINNKLNKDVLSIA